HKLVDNYPEVVAFGFWLGRMERSLGRVLTELGKWREARTSLESSVKRLEGLSKKNPHLRPAFTLLGQAYRDLARVLSLVGETALATEAQRNAREFDPDRGRDPFGPSRMGE